MPGIKDLTEILKSLQPIHQPGDYVFCTVSDWTVVKPDDIQLLFKETEGHTLVLRKELADSLNLSYTFVAGWITLMVHSSLEAVGLTAAFSQALAKAGISCNVVAAYYHDHIFVDRKDVDHAMHVLKRLPKK